jgi:hypothetical protein
MLRTGGEGVSVGDASLMAATLEVDKAMLFKVEVDNNADEEETEQEEAREDESRLILIASPFSFSLSPSEGTTTPPPPPTAAALPPPPLLDKGGEGRHATNDRAKASGVIPNCPAPACSKKWTADRVWVKT